MAKKWVPINPSFATGPELIELEWQKESKIAAEMIGRQVRFARLMCKVTQAELARRLDTKQPSIARIEKGQVIPTIEMLWKICRALGIVFWFPGFATMTRLHSAGSATTIERTR